MPAINMYIPEPLMGQVKEARAEGRIGNLSSIFQAALRTELGQVTSLTDMRVDTVRILHCEREGQCAECMQPWPCRTIQLLG